MTTSDSDRLRDRDATQPVEVQHYGPAAHPDPYRPDWQAAPAWSNRPPERHPAVAARGGMGAMPVITIAVVAGILSGALSAAAVVNMLDDPTPTGAVTNATEASAPVSEVRIDESSAVINAVDRVAPAVVKITAESAGGLFGGSTGTGSGVIYDANGWVLTNRHVAEGSQTLLVELNDGRAFEASVYGVDTLTDLAILKVDANGLPAAPIGSSAELQPGQLAIAIGNPLGYENTVTTGIVSGLGRQITASDSTQTSSETLFHLIQTDAAINPGNSGGPLVNSAGQVIGVNTAVSTTAQGLGFAIPIDFAKPIMQQALDGEELSRPWIGIRYVPLNPSIAEEEDLPVDYGAYIGSAANGQSPIFPDSPAAAAGLQEGDIIVALDGQQITADRDLGYLILPHAPGDTVTLRVLRDSSAREVEVTLGVLPGDAG